MVALWNAAEIILEILNNYLLAVSWDVAVSVVPWDTAVDILILEILNNYLLAVSWDVSVLVVSSDTAKDDSMWWWHLRDVAAGVVSSRYAVLDFCCVGDVKMLLN